MHASTTAPFPKACTAARTRAVHLAYAIVRACQARALTGSPLPYINTWAMVQVWPNDCPALANWRVITDKISCVSLPLKRVPESLQTPPSVLTPVQSIKTSTYCSNTGNADRSWWIAVLWWCAGYFLQIVHAYCIYTYTQYTVQQILARTCTYLLNTCQFLLI